MPLDAEGADSGDAPEEEAQDIPQVSAAGMCHLPSFHSWQDELQAQAVCWTDMELLLIPVYSWNNILVLLLSSLT